MGSKIIVGQSFFHEPSSYALYLLNFVSCIHYNGIGNWGGFFGNQCFHQVLNVFSTCSPSP